MRLYCINTETDNPDWFELHWAGTQADAKKLAKQHRGECFEIDVPTDKPGLLDWLNKHVVIKQIEEAPSHGA